MVIDWQLYSDKSLVINKESVSIPKENKKITYKDEYGTHIINLEHRVYTRIGDDEKMVIDFSKSTISFKFQGHNLDYDITTKFQDDGKIIRLNYSFGEEEKEIRVIRKEEI